MPDRLPDLFDPREFVEKKRRITGVLALERLDRLQDVLADLQGGAEVSLQFRKEGHIAAVEGRVTADLALRCQRCLEILAWPVRAQVRLAVVGSLDEAERLPPEFEPLVVPSAGETALADIVQDELLLAIPAVPTHPDCRTPGSVAIERNIERPFARLADLIKANEE